MDIHRAMAERDRSFLDETSVRIPAKCSPEWAYRVAYGYAQLGYPAAAVPWYEKALNGKGSSDMLLELGQACLQEQLYDKAEASFRQASRMTPLLILPRYYRFQVCLQTGRLEEARELAVEMVEMKVKVTSNITKRIQSEMYIFLSEPAVGESSVRPEINKKGGSKE